MRTGRPSKGCGIAAVILFALASELGAQTGPAGDGDATPPGEPTVSREEAAVLRKADDLAKTDVQLAIAELRRAIRPESSAALLFALGAYCHQADLPEEAERSFRDALARMPDFHRARENLARILLVQGEHAMAARELVTLLDSGVGEKGDLWKLLAYAHLADGNPVAAEAAYRMALVHDTMDPEVRMGLIRALLDQGRPEAARPLLKMELAEDPIRSHVWALLADVELAAGRRHDALIRLECARRLGVAGTEAKLALGDLMMSEGYLSDAIALYRECTELADAPAGRFVRVIEGLVLLGRTGEARALLGDLEAAGREWSATETRRLTSARAALEEADGNTDRALELYRRVLEQDPLDGGALMGAGDILREKGELEEAAILFERAARTVPDARANALVGLARIAVDREDYETAARHLEESLEERRRPHVEHYLEQVRRMLE